MRKLIIVISLIMLAPFVCAQNEYYWSHGERCYLQQRINVYV